MILLFIISTVFIVGGAIGARHFYKQSMAEPFRDIPFDTISKGSLGIGPSTEKHLLVIANDNKEWKAAIEQLKSMGAHLTYWHRNEEKFEIPTSFDDELFDENTIVALFFGPSGGGDTMEITKLRRRNSHIEVHAIKEVPHPSCIVAAIITYPYHIVRIEKYRFPFQLVLETRIGPKCK